MSQQQVRKTRQKKTAEQPVEETPEKTQAEKDKLLAETDAFLDEIDLLLEPNAEEFVKGYKQQGGQ